MGECDGYRVWKQVRVYIMKFRGWVRKSGSNLPLVLSKVRHRMLVTWQMCSVYSSSDWMSVFTVTCVRGLIDYG